MNGDQTLQLIAVLNRAGLLYAMEGQTAVWAEALRDVAYPDAIAAGQALIRDRTSDRRSLTPGDIRAEVRRIRAARLTSTEPPLPAVDPDDVAAYQAERRRLIAEIASGHTNPNQIGA